MQKKYIEVFFNKSLWQINIIKKEKYYEKNEVTYTNTNTLQLKVKEKKFSIMGI